MKVNLHTPIEEIQVQIIPLIDVVFCILTFFLLAALQFTRQQVINVDLPKASTSTVASASSQNASQIVTIDAVGNTYIEKQLVRKEELAQRLKKYLEQNPNGILVLNASRTATYNDVIETLDLLRQVGGDRVSLGIIPGPSQLPTSPIPTNPNFPVNPENIPNTVPIPGINPQGEFNPNLPSNPNQVPLPTTPSLPPTNQGVTPIVPSTQVPQVPTKTNPVPQR
ncbi:biopolymer transporter ExbD [Nostocaceae cyanobacterium CENA369]|uniref:Biopolymer transporter ExbD n=1 Tax=Dendronalium phyllosphericum CENA369 TaxID=1725256 RepID=A0A8J7HYB1_9NOST|nr:biopolymer transporter ExbD [Dendronalium phyllosphericum]MBH8571450.1 biopolymer transporter ExbD [Dendronalium phyllosphericum CENA369]